MFIFRKATEPDFPAIGEILDELDIGHPSLVYGDFWIAADGGKLKGVANVKRCGGYFYLSAVGVRSSNQREGVARKLLNIILPKINKPVCLYTKIPDFFRRFGFIEADPPKEIPPREIYDCGKHCNPAICVCMTRSINASGF